MINRIELHKTNCDNVHNTFRDKDSDYGGSFAKVRIEYPEAICIRLSDKLERLKTLLKGKEQKVSDETIDDTLLDMAGYCILELTHRQIDRLEESMHDEAEQVKAVMEELMHVPASTDETMNFKKALDTLIAQDHAEHFWENRG